MKPKSPSDMDAIELAEWVGWSRYKRPGSIYMPELEIAYLVRCLRRESTGYDDNPKGKLRRHVLLVGPPDTTKSQCAEDFLKEFANAVHYSQLDATQRSMPKSKVTFTNLNGGVTWEALRGGCNDGIIYKPQLHDCDVLYASELFSFLGHTPSQMLHRVDQFNPALQEGWVEVNLAKMKGLPKRVKENFAEEIEDQINDGTIEWNPDDGVMRYHCNSIFIGCTRFLSQEQIERLKPTGFLSRLAIAEWYPNQAELRSYFDRQFGPGDKVAEDLLKELNAFAWKSDYIWVNYPPIRMVDDIIYRLNTIYWDIAQRTGYTFDEVRPGRDRQSVAQLLTAIALSRELKKQMASGKTVGRIDGLEYQDSDVERVFAIKQNELHRLVDRMENSARGDSALSRAIQALEALMRTKITPENEGDPTLYEVITLKEWVEWCTTQFHTSKATAYNWKGHLLDHSYLFARGRIPLRDAGGNGSVESFSVSPSIMERVGALSSETAKQEQTRAMVDSGVFDTYNDEREESWDPQG